MVHQLYLNPDLAPPIEVSQRLPQAAIPFRIKGLPVPRDLVPKQLVVDGPVEMYNLFCWGGKWLFSSKVRALLEPLVQNSIEYVSIDIAGPSWMKLDTEYFFVNITSRLQLIDYTKSLVVRQTHERTDGLIPYTLKQSPPPWLKVGDVVFKDHPNYSIWHEAPMITASEYFSYNPSDIFLSDSLWATLDTAFPGEIESRRFP